MMVMSTFPWTEEIAQAMVRGKEALRRFYTDSPEPCEYERRCPCYRDGPDGTIYRSRHYYCFHWLGAGTREDCPYPARMCRVKVEGEW